MINNVENSILVCRILADNGLGGRSLERAATSIMALGAKDMSNVPQASGSPLADWEKELLDPQYRVKEWCIRHLDEYRTEDGTSYRKIMMIKDVKAAFGLSLKEAKDRVDECVTNADLAQLRERLTGNSY